MTKTKKYKFEAIIKEGRKGGAFVEVPLDIEKIFGTKGRVKVNVVFNGSVTYRGSLAPMYGKHVLGIRKEIRKKLNRDIGDKIKVVFEEDKEPRKVEVPTDLNDKLNENKKLKSVFDKLSYTHQKEYVNWINEAKREETRKRRIEKTLEMLKKK